MTRTVIALTIAKSGLPMTDQTAMVMIAATRANQNSQPAARSARSWARVVED